MQVLVYRKPRTHSEQETQILDRAAHKKHLLKKLIFWDVLLLTVLGVLGPLLHFVAPLFTAVHILRFVAPVNESIWEHLKLLFCPALLVAIVRRLCTGKLQHGILTTFAEGLLFSMGLMVTGFYTYSGILGMHNMIADIVLFYLCSLFLTVYVHRHAPRQKKSSLSGILILLLLTGCFIYFTLYPPNIGIFQDISQQLQ